MVTTQNGQNISSRLTAHRVFLLLLESMRLLGEESRSIDRARKNLEITESGTRPGARLLRRTALLFALLIGASVCCAGAQSTMGSLSTVQGASGAVRVDF
jgi:hypothetical protein